MDPIIASNKNIFGHIHQEILNWYKAPLQSLFIDGVSGENYSLLISQAIFSHDSLLRTLPHLFLFKDQEGAEEFFESLGSFLSSEEYLLLLFASDALSPFSGGVVSQNDLFEKFRVLTNLASKTEKKIIIVATIPAISTFCPPRHFLKESELILSKEMDIPREELSKRLYLLGYQNVPALDGPTTFATKGEIVDIFPLDGPPIRLTFFDDLIESIFAVDANTQKTLRTRELTSVKLQASPLSVIRDQNCQTSLRRNLPAPTPQFPLKYEARKQVFESISCGEWFYEIPLLMPLAFEQRETLLDYLPPETLFHFIDQHESQLSWDNFHAGIKEEYLQHLETHESTLLLPGPEFFFNPQVLPLIWSKKTIYTNTVPLLSEGKNHPRLSLGLEKTKTYLKRKLKNSTDQHKYIEDFFNFLQEEFRAQGHVYFLSQNEKVIEEIKYLIETHVLAPEVKSRIQFIQQSVGEGLYSHLDHGLFMSDQDLFGSKRGKRKKSSAKKVDLFAEQLSTLTPGDFIVHAHHGLAKFLGVSTLTASGQSNDFVVLEYEGGDKIYVPVYKLNLIQKHADSGANIKVANLKNNKFEQLKARAKESAKKLAFDLIKLQAERQAAKAFQFSPPDHYFHEFELAFPFDETDDQLRAIEDVLDDMQRDRPMDRLVCGDVGFGKTEIAMRAAFKAVQDQKQVAVLVPTTILAMQHHHTFCKRFKNFPVRIEYLSRFKSPLEAKKILTDLSNGKVDILIGTHKILAQNVIFPDLGLVIVDEEQRFGVNHKEKLKSLKHNVDFLTLTATPIPRTLQMAFLGIRDLSIIQTPPAGRQGIKSYVIKDDSETIRAAIEKELGRGGQVFYVHNRIGDIEMHVQKIRELVPRAKIVVAHGQLPEGELEKRMLKFYQGEANVLVSTTIIESGLDIPNANTIIIDRADTYGLSQLHQLRGRIGRSERKAYAYFSIPATKNLNDMAQKRIRALQTYTELGAGFALASADLDIRGAGDLLGAEQSGHIEEVGLELYLDLLKEAVAEIKKEKVVKRREVEILVPEPAFLPANYIPDSSQRLKYYKKLSNCADEESLGQIEEELADIFGPLPVEAQGLLLVLKIRNIVHGLGVIAIRSTKDTVHLKFDKAFINSSDQLSGKLIQHFMSRPKVYQITPDYSVIYRHKKIVTAGELLQISKDIARQVEPC